MPTPYEKCKKWIKENPDKVIKIRDQMMETYGFSQEQIRFRLKRALGHLQDKEETKKVQGYRDWNRYLRNWIKPKDWESSGVRTPSKFTKPGGRYRL